MKIKVKQLKGKGMAYIDKLLCKYKEITLSVRGKDKYVILPVERYKALKKAKLEKLINKAEEDYNSGRVIVETAQEHFKRLGI